MIITFSWRGAGILVLVVFPIVMAIALMWPTSGTLVGQARHNDISGLKGSLFLGADINGYSYWGWHGDIKGETPLSSAVSHGSLDTVAYLLRRGANSNQRDGWGVPPICTAAMLGRLDVVKKLVESGAIADLPEIDYNAKPGRTALDWAQREGYDEIVSFLQARSEAVTPNGP